MKLASWIGVLAAAGVAMSWLGAEVARWDRDLLVWVYAQVVSMLVFGSPTASSSRRPSCGWV